MNGGSPGAPRRSASPLATSAAVYVSRARHYIGRFNIRARGPGRPSSASPAATSRRSSSPNASPTTPRSSSSTSPPAASTSAPRPRSTSDRRPRRQRGWRSSCSPRRCRKWSRTCDRIYVLRRGRVAAEVRAAGDRGFTHAPCGRGGRLVTATQPSEQAAPGGEGRRLVVWLRRLRQRGLHPEHPHPAGPAVDHPDDRIAVLPDVRQRRQRPPQRRAAGAGRRRSR